MTVRIFIVLCIATFAAMLGIGIIAPILPLYAKDLGASGTMLGIIFSSFALTMAIANPIAGRISDRVGYKLIIVLGLGIHIFVALSYVIATNPTHLIIIRLTEGILSAMVWTVAMAYVGAVAPRDQEGSYMGIYNTWLLLGMGVGPFIGGLLTDIYNIHMPFYAMAGFLTLAFFLVLFLLPGKKDSSGKSHKKEDRISEHPIKDISRSSLMKGILAFAFIIALGESGLMTFLPLITWREHIPTTQIGILSSVVMLCAGVLQTPFGYLANKYNKVFLVVIGILLVSVDLAYIPLCSSFWSFFILSVIGGIGAAIANPAATAMIIRGSKGLGLGFALGVYNFVFGLGMVIGPVFSGLIMDHFGLDEIFYASAGLFILSACVFYYYTKEIENP